MEKDYKNIYSHFTSNFWRISGCPCREMVAQIMVSPEDSWPVLIIYIKKIIDNFLFLQSSSILFFIIIRLSSMSYSLEIRVANIDLRLQEHFKNLLRKLYIWRFKKDLHCFFFNINSSLKDSKSLFKKIGNLMEK